MEAEFIKELDCKEKPVKGGVYVLIVIAGECVAHYEKDNYCADGWWSFLKVKFSLDEFWSGEMRRAANSTKKLKTVLLDRVLLEGHFSYGTFDTRDYIAIN